jgi:hypothetical protein
VRGKERKRSKRESEIQSFFYFNFFVEKREKGRGWSFFLNFCRERERKRVGICGGRSGGQGE